MGPEEGLGAETQCLGRAVQEEGRPGSGMWGRGRGMVPVTSGDPFADRVWVLPRE